MKRIPWIALLVLLVCIVGIRQLQPRIREQRRSLGLELSHASGEQMPQEVLIAHAALGSFRSWIINFMWIRASYLQDEGRFQEALTLSNWISMLSPSFERVWTFQSWNLSYNVSQYGRNPKERWQWVMAGVDLLRGRGLLVNPTSRALHEELSSIYWRKVQMVYDSDHWYYKRQVARRWQEILGEPPTTKEGYLPVLQKIMKAPASMEHWRQSEPTVAALWQQRLAESELNLALLQELRQQRSELLQEMTASEFEAGCTFVQAAIIRHQEYMDPEFMADLNFCLGPIDWRHPAAHGLYWSGQGSLRSYYKKTRVRIVPGTESYRQMMNHPSFLRCLQNLFEGGHMDYDVELDTFINIPEIELMESYRKSRFSLKGWEGVDDLSRDLFSRHIRTALWNLYFEDEFKAGAIKIYDLLKSRYGVKQELEEYVLNIISELALADEKPYVDQAREQAERENTDVPTAELAVRRIHREEMLTTFCLQIFDRGTSLNRVDSARSLRHHFKIVRDRLAAEFKSFPTFTEIEQQAFLAYLFQSNPVLRKSRVWQHAAAELRKAAGRDVEMRLRAEISSRGYDFEVLFPGLAN